MIYHVAVRRVAGRTFEYFLHGTGHNATLLEVISNGMEIWEFTCNSPEEHEAMIYAKGSWEHEGNEWEQLATPWECV